MQQGQGAMRQLWLRSMKSIAVPAVKTMQNCRVSTSQPRFSASIRSFCTKRRDPSNKSAASAPLDFYDEEVEKDKIFFDAITVLKHDDIDKIPLAKSRANWKDIEDPARFTRKLEFRAGPSDGTEDTTDELEEVVIDELDVLNLDEKVTLEGADVEAEDTEAAVDDEEVDEDELEEALDYIAPKAVPFYSRVENKYSEGGLASSAMNNADVADHVLNFEGNPMLPAEMLDFSNPQRYTKLHPQQANDIFIRKSDPDKYRFDEQGLRSCVGKKQRRGFNGRLTCHLIDLQALTHLDIQEVNRFLSESSEIKPKEQTGLCSKCQRKLAKTVKRARHFGLLPHLGQTAINDIRPVPVSEDSKPFHSVLPGKKFVVSKHIL